jgi:linoleoyl-CoA desaturase
VWGLLPWLAGYLLLNAAMGLTLSIVFQLAHVVEHTSFEEVSEGEHKLIGCAWAEHELKTTSNFAMKNTVLSWLVGGLNFQIEHHLFPRISHIHYPALSVIVMRKCHEFNLPYLSHETFSAAVCSHFRLMRQLGRGR